MPKLKVFIGLGLVKQWLLIRVFILSGVYRFKMLYLPFKYLKKQMGVAKSESKKEVPLSYYEEARSIRNIVLLVCKHTPWERKCLVQALLVQHFLKRKGIATTLYLGVNKDKQDHLMAHTWLRCGEMIVTGQYEKDHFIEVAKFSNESLI